MRGSRLSCVLCTLLSLFMVMPASVASAATEGSGGSGEVTIHYYDSAGWAKPFAYMYGDGVRSASWPGERMADDGDGWYSVTVNAPHGLRVLFSDNGKSQHPGTNQPGYEVNGEAWFVGSAPARAYASYTRSPSERTTYGTGLRSQIRVDRQGGQSFLDSPMRRILGRQSGDGPILQEPEGPRHDGRGHRRGGAGRVRVHRAHGPARAEPRGKEEFLEV